MSERSRNAAEVDAKDEQERSSKAALGETRRFVAARSPLMDALRELRGNPGAVAGAFMLLILIIVAFFGRAIAPYDPIEVTPASILRSPSLAHWLGTDQYGRDILSRILSGASISLRLGVISVLISGVIGTSLGLIAGYWGGWTDKIIMRIIDVMLAFPGILLALVIVAVLGPGIDHTMIAVGIGGIPTFARLVRSSVLTAKENLYVDAARTIGVGNIRIISRHLLPNVVAPVIILTTLGIGTAILIGASLSFLGLGAQPPTPEWGAMLSNGRDFLRHQWWISTFPGLAIVYAVLTVNLLGDGLRDALDPRLRT